MKSKTAVKWTIGVIATVVLLAVGTLICLFAAFFVSIERGEKHQRQIRAEQRSGRWDFGDQPALFAVAQGIVKNDPDAIRAAAKGVPDLQAPGRDGAPVLYFAVTQSWQRPELTEAVRFEPMKDLIQGGVTCLRQGYGMAGPTVLNTRGRIDAN